ncbi:hypothetical protein AVEN_274369-1 [Araneus ventricosus]|uniref:Uncharacterized protein n=1 Tax=Araneus ventricosus TaxID=182803 RepID=A0A4Y2MKC2_ARAVE|nr:hypothetical protein AVEN_274369-1 [Araneus ventricosus]
MENLNNPAAATINWALWPSHSNRYYERLMRRPLRQKYDPLFAGPRSGFAQRFPCDVTPRQDDYKYTTVRVNWERLWSANASEDFGVSSAVQAGKPIAKKACLKGFGNLVFSKGKGLSQRFPSQGLNLSAR